MVKQNVAVLVFGDVGRSPRMQNHAMLLADYYNVFLVGDKESPVYPELSQNKSVHQVDLSSRLISLAKKTHIFLLYLIVRIIVQTLSLLWTFVFKLRRLKFVVVQNPPSIPVLAVLWLASCLKGFEIVVDFHNYGYTILALKIKFEPIIKIAQRYQKFFSKRCHKHLCVSAKMQQDLKNQWGINAVELRDAPTQRGIVKMEESERDTLLEKVTGSGRGVNQLIIVSSTSWTKDEDFSTLLQAVQRYEAEWTDKLPKLRVYITGKGPEKAYYEKYIRDREISWKHIQVKTLWLSHEQYPKFLASCDLGVCLHYSSSGLDLPMKVVDMLSAGIPILAIRYPTIGQLVLQPYNGYLFNTTEQLYQRIQELASSPQHIAKMADFIKSTRSNSFENEWKNAFTKLKLLPGTV